MEWWYDHMTVFLLAGIISHWLSLWIVLLRLVVSQNAQGTRFVWSLLCRSTAALISPLPNIGISLRTHELFLLGYLTRFMYRFSGFYYYSMYGTVIQCMLIGITASIVWMMRYRAPVQSTYDAVYDSSPHWRYVVIPCALITLILNWMWGYFFHQNRDVWGMLFTFPYILGSVAIVPQLVLLQQAGGCDNVTGSYIVFMGANKALYLLHWMVRAPPNHIPPDEWVSFACAVVHTMVYVIFFGCIFQNSASLRRKKDDAQPELASELEAPLVALELQPSHISAS
jgi:ER lumen protein retaining receptor